MIYNQLLTESSWKHRRRFRPIFSVFADIMRKYGVIITAGALKPPQGMMQSEAAECEFSAVCSLSAARLWKDEQLDPSANLTLFFSLPLLRWRTRGPGGSWRKGPRCQLQYPCQQLNKSQQKVRRGGPVLRALDRCSSAPTRLRTNIPTSGSEQRCRSGCWEPIDGSSDWWPLDSLELVRP